MSMRFFLAISALFFWCVTAGAESRIDSAYTRLRLEECKEKAPRNPDQGEGTTWRCTGHGGIPVLLSESDLRFFVTFGERGWEERAGSETLLPFNHPGDTIEWRLERDGDRWRAFATILRWHTDVDGYKGEVLVVTRLGRGETCHVAYVDARANRNANRLAREAADRMARNFRCGIDRPVEMGVRGRSY